MKNLIFISFLTILSSNVFSQTIEKLKLSESEVSKDYKFSESLKCKSVQACTFYKNPELYEMFIGKLKSKSIQNFNNSNDSGSILYFEFEKDFESEVFLKSLLWGENDKPTKTHPEEIFVKNNILIIWSLKIDSELKKISKNKIEAELK